MEKSLEPSLVEQSLNFHGQQMLKLWESERGETDLAKIGTKALDFQVYQQRSKSLSFQDRGKRLRLQQFIVNKANFLFGPREQDDEVTEKDLQLTDTEGLYAAVPLQDVFRRLDQPAREKFLLQYMKPGGIAYCTVMTNNKFSGTLIMKALCLEDLPYDLTDLNIKAFCQLSKSVLAIPPTGGEPRPYCTGDIVRCEIVESHPTSEKIVCGMKGEFSGSTQGFGLVTADQLPKSFKQQEQMELTYEQMLEQNVGFHNPNSTGLLASLLGAGSKTEADSLMRGLKGYFPENEYASELRQIQAGRWAFRSVAEGIEHFKAGRHGEAFQCLNKALNIDPRNTEGLVARGALYANSGSFEKAIEDFEDALKSNPTHLNARKYLGETLVAFGRKFEEDGNFDQAMKSYERCLTVIPFHEEAQNSIKYLQNKIANKAATPTLPEIFLPGLTPAKTMEVKETLKQLLRRSTSDHDRSRSKKKRGKKHKRHLSSSSSSSSSDSSGSSSSTSTSRDSSSGSSHSRTKKQRKRSRKRSQSKNKEKSLSPLSKRMALLDPSHGGGFNETAATALGTITSQLGNPYVAAAAAATSRFPFGQGPSLFPGPSLGLLEYDQQVRHFLERVKGDSDGEHKIRKLLEETERLRKESKNQDARKKKKKEKTKSKEKEKSKKKKKEKDREEKKKKHKDKARRTSRGSEPQGPRSDDDYLYGPSPDHIKEERNSVVEIAPELDDVELKLSNPYAKVDKDSVSHRRWDDDGMKEKKRMSESPVPKIKKRYSSESSQEPNHGGKDKRKMDIFANSPSPPPLPPSPPPMKDSRMKQEMADNLAGKWKGMTIPTSSKLKGKKKADKNSWDEFEEKRFAFADDDSDAASEKEERRKNRRPSGVDDTIKKEEDAPDSVNRAQQYASKYQGGYRISSERKAALAESSLPPENSPPKLPLSSPPRPLSKSKAVLSSDSSSDRGKRNGPSKVKARPSKSRSSSRSLSSRSRSLGPRQRSRSRSPVRRRKSRSRSLDSRSRSRSRSYNRYSRSRSRGTRSRSRSRSYSRRRSRSYDRSRSRSRSLDDRRRYDSRSKYPQRYQRRGPQQYYRRGNYQQNYNKSPRGGQGYGYRNNQRGYYQNKYQQRGGRGNYIQRSRRPRGRYYNKPGPSYYNRRYDHRARSRDRYSSSPERNRSYRSPESDDTMRKVDEAKERINKTIAEKEEARRHQSEGEEEEGEYRGDEGSDYVDSKTKDRLSP